MCELSHLLVSFSLLSSSQRWLEFKNGLLQLSHRRWDEFAADVHPTSVFLSLTLGTTGWSQMGERSLDARQSQGTLLQMQRGLLAGGVAQVVESDPDLSSKSLVSEPGGRVSEPGGRDSTDEDEVKMVSTEGQAVSSRWLGLTSGDSWCERSSRATGALAFEEAGFFKRKASRLCRSLFRVALDFFRCFPTSSAGNDFTLFSEQNLNKKFDPIFRDILTSWPMAMEALQSSRHSVPIGEKSSLGFFGAILWRCERWVYFVSHAGGAKSEVWLGLPILQHWQQEHLCERC